MSSYLNNINLSNYYTHTFFSPNMRSVCSKYEKLITKVIAEGQKVLTEKAVVALHLDKIGHLGGKAASSDVATLGYSSSVLASVEMIHALIAIQDDPALSDCTKKI